MRNWIQCACLVALVVLVREDACAEVLRDVVYGTAGGEELRLDVRIPQGRPPYPVAVLVHGGGWGSGDKGGADKPGSGADITPWFAPLEEAGVLAFSINYRLAPAHRWPACFEDVQTAIRWVKTHAAEYGGDPERIALFGHSAGGHLAFLAAVQATEDTRVQAAVGFAPVTDFEQDLPIRGGLSVALQNLHGRPKEPTAEALAILRETSPVNHVRPGLPPFLIVHGDADRTVPLEQSRQFLDRLAVAGVRGDLVVLRGAPHRLTEWDVHDASWSTKVVAWLRAVWGQETETRTEVSR
ncbi:hypothetical protein ASA1KI_44050 [Opitutales bacterium ASA1]|uniref:alpha/beta hydrolase fold domain-containing protein n=1 Tax=Congregicoccus parvus TaxID=3081749 RepID=UPI002B2939F8|nr:hypothetical protein ASA1KI_44050 [Opitutales bacterium ASA1]